MSANRRFQEQTVSPPIAHRFKLSPAFASFRQLSPPFISFCCRLVQKGPLQAKGRKGEENNRYRKAMGILGFWKSKEAVSSKAKDEISQVVEVCDENECCGECSHNDDSADGESTLDLDRDEATFSKLKIEQEEPLYGSSKSSKIHFVVPTSQTDWKHDACVEKDGSVQYKIDKWLEKNKGRYENQGSGQVMRCSVSSLPIDIMDVDVMRGKKNNVLVLPHFLWINNLRSDEVDATLDDLVPLLLEDKREQLLAKDNITESRQQAFVFLCSHRTRDKRCGITAPILQRRFDKELQKHGLYRDVSDFRPDGVTVAFVNHVGGHKFAANALLYLKKSHSLIWLGRVTPKHVKPIVDLMIMQEKPKLPWPDKVRCVQKYESW